MYIIIHLSFAQTAALEGVVQETPCAVCKVKERPQGGKYHVDKMKVWKCSDQNIFSAGFCGSPPEKLPEGRHYREFFHEGAQEFSIDFLPILVTFGSPGVLLVTLGASLGPRPQFLMNFDTLLGSPGPPRRTLGGPCGTHGASWCRPGPHF